MTRPDGANPGEDGPGHGGTCLAFVGFPLAVGTLFVGLLGLGTSMGIAVTVAGLVVLAASVTMVLVARRRGERQE